MRYGIFIFEGMGAGVREWTVGVRFEWGDVRYLMCQQIRRVSWLAANLLWVGLVGKSV